ncbi:MAG: hypothetical protein Q7K45_00435 [Nanoarchaeota archaeon]|nr:hypothetical protein [Nanoarchaeota archaeon]
MGKKRPFALEKRAQITIFMILGVLLLVIFLFLMQVASQAQKSQFLTEQEKVFSKAFKKESLRLYVDDCLRDELEKGLILLGKQGTIWADQPGGIKQFSEGQNGLTYSTTEEVGEFHSGRIAYAITDEHYLQFPGAYPCDSESGPPSFCQYHHPNISVRFGAVTLLPRTFTSDLKQYLLDRTAWCVQNYVLTDISRHAEIVSTEIELDLTIDEEGIGVKINYPLKFNVGGEEIFSLSTFDFFYPSKFKQLLTVATFALDQDQKLVDFNHTLETFTQPIFTYSSEKNMVPPCIFDEELGYFRCERAFPLDTYQSLGITMTPESLPNGDDIFTFTPALYEIVDNPEAYSLRIARQNRPPALDYVQRAACPAEGYDYLVIKEDERYGYGDLNLVPHAIDPDEDRFTIDFSEELGPAPNDILYRDADDVERITNGIHTVTVAATDDHGKTDSQEVRVLVDRPIQLDLSLEFPEEYSDFLGNSQIGESNTYVISKEDPAYLHVIIPEQTETTTQPQTVDLNYYDGTETTLSLGLGNAHNTPAEQCYNFPLKELNQESESAETCLLSNYDSDQEINSFNTPSNYFSYPFEKPTSTENPGRLTLNFHHNYCGALLMDQSNSIEVLVTDCVPLQNPEHPWASPNHKLKYPSFNFETQTGECVRGEDGRCVQEEINPFLATHSCCVGNPSNPASGRIKRSDEGPCFINPEPGCYGKAEEYIGTDYESGYILEQEKQFCRGAAAGGRGNICDGNRNWDLYNDELKCGFNNPAYPRCSDIRTECQGALAFGFAENSQGIKGWCDGKMGCGHFCSTAVAYTGLGSYFAGDNGENINEIAKADLITKNQEMADAGFKCGCENVPSGTLCDSTFNGGFNGRCNNGQCIGDN